MLRLFVLPSEEFKIGLRFCLNLLDPLGQPTVGIIVFAPVVRLSSLLKTKKQKTVLATGETMGLAEWIIDDTCLVQCLKMG